MWGQLGGVLRVVESTNTEPPLPAAAPPVAATSQQADQH
jgi:hypothetical protein